MSDSIEKYLKEILEVHEQIEIRRSEMADLFDCVPSQINYVINTRFTLPKGYKVESKRGGGGYIRIVKIDLLQHSDYLYQIGDRIDSNLTEGEAIVILDQLMQENLLTQKEKELISSMLTSKSLLLTENSHQLRAELMFDLLNRLAYE